MNHKYLATLLIIILSLSLILLPTVSSLPFNIEISDTEIHTGETLWVNFTGDRDTIYTIELNETSRGEVILYPTYVDYRRESVNRIRFTQEQSGTYTLRIKQSWGEGWNASIVLPQVVVVYDEVFILRQENAELLVYNEHLVDGLEMSFEKHEEAHQMVKLLQLICLILVGVILILLNHRLSEYYRKRKESKTDGKKEDE